MVERPIPYSPPMARARREGLKTNTRRVVRPQPSAGFALGGYSRVVEGLTVWGARCPYGVPGDRLWVREPWRTLKAYDALPPRDVPKESPLWFEADGPAPAEFGRYRHAKFMCRWMSRGLDEVVATRVERLQDISEADAKAEGCAQNHNGYFWGGPHAVSGLKQMATAQQAYRDLWESINGPGTWAANPYVWVVVFKVLH